jgi:hypothetical protein
MINDVGKNLLERKRRQVERAVEVRVLLISMVVLFVCYFNELSNRRNY